jgi:tetratricopeptide (TPR) repeat protein
MALTLAGCASAQRTALRTTTAASTGALAAGDYGKALDLYQKLYEKDRANGKVVSKYAAMIEEVKAAGDGAADKGSYATAQATFKLLADHWDGFSALGRRLSFKKSDLEAEAKDCRLALCECQFRQEIGSGNYAKALAAYQSVLKDYNQDKAVKARYLKGVAEIAAIAAKALEAKDYALAGRIDGLLLRNVESFVAGTGAPAEGAPSRDSLTKAVRVCSSELTTSGLTEYRKGNLESAISAWDELLSFDPGNAEVKKAVETARAQLGKIKSSGKGGSRGQNARNGRGAVGAH